MGIIQSYLEKITEINKLDIAGSNPRAGKWIFHHGMLFLSPDKWWQHKIKKRKTLHEGIDILLYEDKNKQIQKLNTDTLIPSATNGKIINICDDFLGQSIVVMEKPCFQQKFDLVFIYAHILPDTRIRTGINLKQGDIIASIANASKRNPAICSHLHLSVIEIPKNIPAKHLNWEFFSNRKSRLNLINPLFL